MRVLIIGLGSIAKKHIDALRKIDQNVEIFAYRSNVLASKEQFVENVFSFDFLITTQVDFIIISTPTYLHNDNISDLLDYNIPLFIEKPLSDSLEVEDMVIKAKEKKCLTYVACNLRFLESLKFVKENLLNLETEINEVNVYCGSYLPEWRPSQDFRESYSSDPKRGGGVHLDLIHELDYVYWLFGNPESVKSDLRSKSTLNISSVDYANYLLEYSRFAISIVLNYYRRTPKRTLEIVTERETFLVDVLKNKVYRNEELIFQTSQTVLDTYEAQLRYFIDTIIVKKENGFNDIKEAFEVLKITLNDIKR